MVEGDSDETFLARMMQLHIPDRRVTIVRSGGEGKVIDKLKVLTDALGDLHTSPYRNRFFIVLDSKNSLRADRLEKQGVPKNNIKIWSKNGIEYLYPEDILADIFLCGVSELEQINLEADEAIQFNDVKKSKTELARAVVDKLSVNHTVQAELRELISQIRSACGSSSV
jgi:sorbitol-specific phosphotransferase system component IIBC